MGPQNGSFGENEGPNLRYWFRDPQKALPSAEPRRLTYFASKSVHASRLQPSAWGGGPPQKKYPSHLVPRGAKSRMCRTETPKPIWIKFCMVVYITDLVTYTNFADHRFMGFWVAGGQISPFS